MALSERYLSLAAVCVCKRDTQTDTPHPRNIALYTRERTMEQKPRTRHQSGQARRASMRVHIAYFTCRHGRAGSVKVKQLSNVYSSSTTAMALGTSGHKSSGRDTGRHNRRSSSVNTSGGPNDCPRPIACGVWLTHTAIHTQPQRLLRLGHCALAHTQLRQHNTFSV